MSDLRHSCVMRPMRPCCSRQLFEPLLDSKCDLYPACTPAHNHHVQWLHCLGRSCEQLV
jgi:hypothetical protein